MAQNLLKTSRKSNIWKFEEDFKLSWKKNWKLHNILFIKKKKKTLNYLKECFYLYEIIKGYIKGCPFKLSNL